MLAGAAATTTSPCARCPGASITTLLTAALMLATILPSTPSCAWLTGQVLLLVVYVGLGTLALKRGSTRAAAGCGSPPRWPTSPSSRWPARHPLGFHTFLAG